MWIDTHCHIHSEDDPLAVARQAYDAGVDALVCIGTDVPSSNQALGVAATIESQIESGSIDLPRAYSTVGLHPHDASNQATSGIEGIARLVERNRLAKVGNLVGIGECGLDYYYELSSKEEQQKAFVGQIELAKLFDLTLVIHTRDAWDDTFSILRSQGMPNRVLFHCFTGDKIRARQALDLGAYLSYSGIVTFKNAQEIREAALFTPLNRMVIETDSPFLAPVPYRGKPNTPAYVGVVGEFLADLLNVSVNEFSQATTSAARECFSIKS